MHFAHQVCLVGNSWGTVRKQNDVPCCVHQKLVTVCLLGVFALETYLNEGKISHHC